MDVLIEPDHPNTTFTSGDTISGHVVIYCPNTTIVISKIEANLMGDSTTVLTDKTGLLMDRKEEEKHRFIHENQSLFPNWNTRDNTKVESLKLGFGYHRFHFEFKLPWITECTSCPPESPVFRDGIRAHGSSNLPSSMENLVRGADVTYRIETSVTTYRNLFRSTTRKSIPITVWPVDKYPVASIPTLLSSIPSTKSTSATILSTPRPPPPPPPSPTKTHPLPPLPAITPSTQVLITAHFIQDFHLSYTRSRNIALHLTARTPQDPNPPPLYLSSFQLLLFAYTDIRAGAASSGHMSCWTIQSLSNLKMKLHCDGSAGNGNECEIDAALWRDKCIPESAVPSFEACNLARRYEVEILLGLQCGEEQTPGQKSRRVSVVQIRVPVKIGSGLAPGKRLSGVEKEEVPVVLEPGEKDRFLAPPSYEQAIRGSGKDQDYGP